MKFWPGPCYSYSYVVEIIGRKNLTKHQICNCQFRQLFPLSKMPYGIQAHVREYEK